MEFLPITRREMLDRGWDACDFVYIIGDAYVDHPSFGHAIISRVLESHGYNVGIISQPDWKNPKSIDVFGRPRLGFLVSGGNMDSMVNHYSVTKHHRKTDAFTPGGVMGKRPDYATTVYCNLIRQTYKDVPILIGGIEASLRRLGHYDYWSDTMKRSILLDSQADLLMYGMGEKTIVEVADALNSGLDVKDITYIDGTVFKTKAPDDSLPTITLPSFAEIKADRRRYAESFKIQYANCDPFTAKRLAEPYDNFFVVQNPPQKPLTTAEMDAVYDLPYMRAYHPSYEKAGGVPAIEEVKFSLVSNRGCFGACSFCALTFHQGRIVQTRSHESILREAEIMVKDRDFKGYIHDVGGPTANFRHPACEKQLIQGCLRRAAVPLPHPLQEHERRPLGLCRTASQAAEAPRRQKGVRPQRHPFRLSAGGQKRHLFPGAGAVPHFRSAESRPGACVRRGSRPDGQAQKRGVQPVCGKIFCPEPAVRHESVSRPLSHVQPSRLDTQGGRGAGRVHPGHGL